MLENIIRFVSQHQTWSSQLRSTPPVNAMTMAVPIHQDFGNLQIAFLATVCVSKIIKLLYAYLTRIQRTRIGSRYTESSQVEPTPFPQSGWPATRHLHAACHLWPTNRALLETHAAIAEILHASGQAEQIDEIPDMKRNHWLAADGRTNVHRLLSLVYVH
jgi:hypothetical protein